MQAWWILVVVIAVSSHAGGESAVPSFENDANIMDAPDTLTRAPLAVDAAAVPSVFRMAESEVSASEDPVSDATGAEQGEGAGAAEQDPEKNGFEAPEEEKPEDAEEGKPNKATEVEQDPESNEEKADEGKGETDGGSTADDADAAGDEAKEGEGEADADAGGEGEGDAAEEGKDGEGDAAEEGKGGEGDAAEGDEAKEGEDEADAGGEGEDEGDAAAAEEDTAGEGEAEADGGSAAAATGGEGDAAEEEKAEEGEAEADGGSAAAATGGEAPELPPGLGPKGPEDADDHWRASGGEDGGGVVYTSDGKSNPMTQEEAEEAGEKAGEAEAANDVGAAAVEATGAEALKDGSSVLTGEVTSDSVTQDLWDKNPMNKKALQISLGQMLLEENVLLEATGGAAGGVIIMGLPQCKDSPIPMPSTADADAAKDAGEGATAALAEAEAALAGAEGEEAKAKAEGELAGAMETQKLAVIGAEDAVADTIGPVGEADAAKALVEQLEREAEGVAEPASPQSIERLSFTAEEAVDEADYKKLQAALVKYYADAIGIKPEKVNVDLNSKSAPAMFYALVTFDDAKSKAGGKHIEAASTDAGLVDAGIKDLQITLVAKALGGGKAEAPAEVEAEGEEGEEGASPTGGASADEEAKGEEEGASATGGEGNLLASNDAYKFREEASKFRQELALLEMRNDEEPKCRFPFKIIIPKAAGMLAGQSALDALLNPSQKLEDLFVVELKAADASAELLLSSTLGFSISATLSSPTEEDVVEDEKTPEEGSALAEAGEMAAVGAAGPPKGHAVMNLLLNIGGVGLEALVLRKWKIGAMVEAVMKDEGVNSKASVEDVYAQEEGPGGKCVRAAESGKLAVIAEGDDAAAAFLQLQEERLLRHSHRHEQQGALAAKTRGGKSCPIGVSVSLLVKKKYLKKATLVQAKTTDAAWFHRAENYLVITPEEAEAMHNAAGSKGSDSEGSSSSMFITAKEVKPQENSASESSSGDSESSSGASASSSGASEADNTLSKMGVLRFSTSDSKIKSSDSKSKPSSEKRAKSTASSVASSTWLMTLACSTVLLALSS